MSFKTQSQGKGSRGSGVEVSCPVVCPRTWYTSLFDVAYTHVRTRVCTCLCAPDEIFEDSLLYVELKSCVYIKIC